MAVAVLSAALLFWVATPGVRADDDRAKCQHAVEKAEGRLDKAVGEHGPHSPEADERRRDLVAERQHCWDRYHQWWNGREHRWETEQNWDDYDRHYMDDHH